MGRVCTDDDAMAAIEMIADEGCYQKEAAKRLDVDYWSLCRMLATPTYKALVDQARIGAAETQEALALAALDEIDDDAPPGQIARQKAKHEHHWKSAKVRDPRSYGDRVEISVEHKVDLIGAIEEGKRRAMLIVEGRATEMADAAITFDACENTENPVVLP
jgi:hypothetical protein